MTDVSDVQHYLLSFMASPLSFYGDCNNISDIVDRIEKDEDNVRDDSNE